MAKSPKIPKKQKPETLAEFIEDWKTNGFRAYTEGLNVDYRTTACECGPDRDDYCRCTRIEDIEVNHNLMFFYSLFEMVEEIKQDPIIHLLASKYCFRHAVFRGTSEGGYYGEELGPVFWENPEIIEEYLQATDKKYSEMLKQFLLEEYHGVLADNVRDYFEADCEWNLILTTTDKVKHSGIHHAKFNNDKSKKFTKTLNDFTEQMLVNQTLTDANSGTNFHLQMKANKDKVLKTIELYAAICVPEGNGFYKIIDGNHKFNALNNFYKKTYNKNPYNTKVQGVGIKKLIKEFDETLDEKKMFIFVPVIT